MYQVPELSSLVLGLSLSRGGRGGSLKGARSGRGGGGRKGKWWKGRGKGEGRREAEEGEEEEEVVVAVCKIESMENPDAAQRLCWMQWVRHDTEQCYVGPIKLARFLHTLSQ